MTGKLLTPLNLFALAFFFIINLSFGQDSLIYKPLRCAGQIPDDFLQLSSQKVQTERDQINRQNISRRDKKLSKEFALNTNFGVDEILFSGKVLYGDALSVYVNKVAAQVLEKEPELKSQLRFYVIKMSGVNAFSTHQGIVFVSVGLISQIENEAQLAFILCHEIAHYKLKHGLEAYKRNIEIMRGRGNYRSLDFEERTRALYSHSRDQETEADREGLKMFLNTSYSTSAVISSFDILLYSYLAYDEIDWNKKEFQDSFYKFPSSYVPSKPKAISADEEEDDEESTHPNISKRKAEMEKLLEKQKGRRDSAIHTLGQDYFSRVQQQSRIELFFILMNQARYEKAYYLSYLYKNIYHDTTYAAQIAAYCVYGKTVMELCSKEDSKLDLSSYMSSGNQEEGAFYYVAYFFDKIGDKELAVLGVRTAWQGYIRNRNDSFYRRVFESSAKILFKHTSISLVDFYRAVDTAAAVDSGTEEETGTENLWKVEKLKRKQKKQTIASKKDKNTSSGEMYRFAFLEYFKDEYFSETLDNAYKRYGNKDDEEEEDEYISYNSTRKFRKKYGTAGNIDSMILVNPEFGSSFPNNSEKKNLVYDEEQETVLARKYIEMARMNNITVTPLNLMDKENLTTETLNEYSAVMEWLTERLNNFSSENILFNEQFIDKVTEAKGTSKLCLSGISYVVTRQEFNAIAMVYSIIMLPVFPIYLFAQLHKTHYFRMTTIIFDLKSGQLEFFTSNRFHFKYKKQDYLNSQIYALFNQISTKRK